MYEYGDVISPDQLVLRVNAQRVAGKVQQSVRFEPAAITTIFDHFLRVVVGVHVQDHVEFVGHALRGAWHTSSRPGAPRDPASRPAACRGRPTQSAPGGQRTSAMRSNLCRRSAARRGPISLDQENEFPHPLLDVLG